jgi:FkbM family methyltransferase
LKLINALPFSIKGFIARSRVLAVLSGTKYWGLGHLDQDLIKIIGTKRGFFVELGANDGITQSNTKTLEMFHGWSGVLIEPSPSNFTKLAKTRSPRTHFVNAACVSFDFQKPQIELTYSNLMTTPMEGTSDIENRQSHAESGRRFLGRNERVFTFTATARTLDSILDEARAPKRIELLSLDVEGGELEVLNGLDHKKYRFSWILVESRDELRMSTFLTSRGYKLRSKLTGHDYLFEDLSRVKN